VQITVGKIRKFSITLVFVSRSYFPHRSPRFALPDCCSQSSPIRRRCRNFCFEVFLGRFEDAYLSWYFHGMGWYLSYVRDWSFHKMGLIWMAPSLKPESRWFNPEAASNFLNQIVNPFVPLAHPSTPDHVTLPISSTRPIITSISLSLFILDP
jgi:hypothetical protein